MLALIRLEIDGVLGPKCYFKTEAIGRECRGTLEIRCAETHIGNVLQIDHPALLGRC
jgi:hypothetical protein